MADARAALLQRIAVARAYWKDPEPKPDTPPPNVVLGHVNLRQASITVQDQRLQKPFEATFKDLDLTLNNVATRSTEAGDFRLHATTSFGADLAAMRHETMDVRIFRT